MLLFSGSLLFTIYQGLGNVEGLVETSKTYRSIVEGVRAFPLEMADADVTFAELLLKAPGFWSERGTFQEEGLRVTSWRTKAVREAALELLIRALRTQQLELGPAHPKLAPTATTAAETCLKLGKTQEAQEFSKQALGALSSVGASDWLQDAPELMAQLATIFLGLGQPEQGLELVRRAEGLLLKKRRKREALAMLAEYSGDLLQRKEWQAALSLLSHAVKAYSGTLRRERALHLELLYGKGYALSHEGQNDAALDSLERAWAVFKKAEKTAELRDIAVRVNSMRARAYYLLE